MSSPDSFFEIGGAARPAGGVNDPAAPVVARLAVESGPHGMRRLVVAKRGADLAVRHDDGRLLWLRTATLLATRDVEDATRVCVDAGNPDDSSLLLPRDHGIEGIAVSSMEGFRDSFHVIRWGLESEYVSVAGDSAPGGMEKSGQRVVHCMLESYGSCELRLDRLTSLVTYVKTEGVDNRQEHSTRSDKTDRPAHRRSLFFNVTEVRHETDAAVTRWFEPRDL